MHGFHVASILTETSIFIIFINMYVTQLHKRTALYWHDTWAFKRYAVLIIFCTSKAWQKPAVSLLTCLRFFLNQKKKKKKNPHYGFPPFNLKTKQEKFKRSCLPCQCFLNLLDHTNSNKLSRIILDQFHNRNVKFTIYFLLFLL